MDKERGRVVLSDKRRNGMDRWYKENESDTIWWLDNSDEVKGEFVFSFDKKETFNLFADYPHKLTKEQKEKAIEYLDVKEELEKIYNEGLCHPDVVGLSIGTRPDCLGEEVFEAIDECKKLFPHKFIWIELGLQTIHEKIKITY